jgi:hypothetical protein
MLYREHATLLTVSVRRVARGFLHGSVRNKRTSAGRARRLPRRTRWSPTASPARVSGPAILLQMDVAPRPFATAAPCGRFAAPAVY